MATSTATASKQQSRDKTEKVAAFLEKRALLKEADAQQKIEDAKRDRRQACAIRENGDAIFDQDDDAAHKRLNSRGSYLRRSGQIAKATGAWKDVNSPTVYRHAMKLFRFIVRDQHVWEGPREIPMEKMIGHMSLSEKSIENLLLILKGKGFRVRGKLLPGLRNDDHSPFIRTTKSGRRSCVYSISKPRYLLGYRL